MQAEQFHALAASFVKGPQQHPAEILPPSLNSSVDSPEPGRSGLTSDMLRPGSMPSLVMTQARQRIVG